MNSQERNELLEELKTEYPILEQVKFNEFTINEKIQENMSLRMKYKELYDHHKFVYDKMCETFDEVKCERYDYYRFEHDRKLGKTEIEEYYLPHDKKLKPYKDKLEKQKLKVDFFKLCHESIEKLYWRMKQFIDNERIN